ncbi:MAG: sulfolactate dehydrogenase [Rhodospirillaceae bacterium]|nr:sulfolactate dehydrogenase [Rhodospirillaceae bacterium]
MTVKKLDDLEQLALKIFLNSNVSETNAAHVVRALVQAEADGVPSHGLSRIPSYADQAKSGKVDGHAIARIEQTATAALRVDANGGFAYPAIHLGLGRAMDLVREAGIVGLGIGNSHHGGVGGHPVEAAARAGLIAMGFLNAPAAIAPWNGNRALYGTNPIAFACPRPDGKGGWGDPILVDLALSKVARGKIMMAANKGEPIPEGWSTDKHGNPTTDAKEAIDGGMMIPMGDAKGAALVLMVEILAATLTGSNHGFEASSFFSADGVPPKVGQFFILIDPSAFAHEDEETAENRFVERIGTLITAITDQDGAWLPGVDRWANRAKSQAEGVDVPDALLADLEARAAG